MMSLQNMTTLKLAGFLLVSTLLAFTDAANVTFPSTTNVGDIADNTTGAVFVYSSVDTNTQLIFALTADADTNDLYIHMSAPAGNSWFGIGFGERMAHTRMLIMYASRNGSGVTLSPRLTTGHTEPVYDPSVSCELVWDRHMPYANSVSNEGNRSTTNYLTVDAVCRNATIWAGGELKLGNRGDSSQPMIFAGGPGWGMQSDGQNAALRRHAFFGHFTMDMRAATKRNASIPMPNGLQSNYTTLHASGTATDVHQDRNALPFLHGFAMCLIFVVVFPFGSLILRVFNKVKLHAAVQVVGYVLLVLAMAGGIHVSKQYNRSKEFKSAHQVLGLMIVMGVSAQVGLGIVNHSFVKRGQSVNQQRTLLAKVHLVLGPGAIILGIINGGIGFQFAQNCFLGRRYAVVVIAIALLYLAVRLTIHFCAKRRKEMKLDETMEMTGGPEGYQYPQFGPPPAYPASGHQVHPPSYAGERTAHVREQSSFMQQGAPVQERHIV